MAHPTHFFYLTGSLSMFSPTHYLVTKNRKTPVQVIPAKECFKLLTEFEAEKGKEPAFEMRPRQGFFCKDVLVLGYSLEAMDGNSVATQPTTQPQSTQSQSESATEPAISETVVETSKAKSKTKKTKEKSLA
jgi:hypothetical protein